MRKEVSIKPFLIAATLIFSINGCSYENISSDTPDAEHLEKRIDSRYIIESSGARSWQYFWKGDYGSSLEMLYLVLGLVESQDPPQRANYYDRLGLLHSRLGNYELSEYYFNKALQVTQIDTDTSMRLRALRNFVSLHASRGDIERFETTMEMKEAVRESLITSQQQMQHEAKKKNELLVQKTANAQRKRNINAFLTAIMLLAIALAIVTFLFARGIKRQAAIMKREHAITVRHYEELLELKKQIKTQHNNSEKTDEKADEPKQLASDIQQLFETEKIYRQQGLSVDDVAKRLQTSCRQLSNAISQYYKKNFMEYVNTFRVEEAIEMLKQQGKGGKYAHFTIQAVGEEVGFNGRTSFYRAFNRIVGLAPSEYIENLNVKENDSNDAKNANNEQ